jgi:Carboxypeptidase regulatory-like domain/TonB dependent receptor-like, beta-barrel
MMFRQNAARISHLILWLCLCVSAAMAQSSTATLNGTVSDENGAVVAGATVTLTNTATGQSRTAASNSAGFYTFPQVKPDRYKLKVERQGFAPMVREEVLLQVGDTVVLDLTLKVGGVGETVTVMGNAAPLLETGSSSLGEVVNSRTIESLPLNGRNTMQLVALTPGVSTQRAYRTSAFGSGAIASNAFSANGGRNVVNEIMVDGSPQIVMGYNQPAWVPNPDATQEFKVQTNGLSAEYGRTGGAVVNLVTRSGTNEFHGALFEFVRNDLFDANGFFNNLNDRDKAPFRFNQFGGTVGGPVYLPRFGQGGPGAWSGKNRTFFFFSYEGVRQVNPGSSSHTVPTAKMRAGDFTEILGANQCTNASNAIGNCGAFTTPYLVTDTTGARIQARAGMIFDPATIDASGRRRAFAGNIIPTARISPVALKILSFYPDPNRSGLINNYFTQAGSRTNVNDYSARVDHRWTDTHTTFFRYSQNILRTIQPDIFNNSASPGNGVDGRVSYSTTVDHTWARNQWVLHVNYGYVYHSNPRDYKDRNFSLTTLGLPQAVADYAQYKAFPTITATGFNQLGSEPAWFIGNEFETHTLTGDATRVVGNHTLKFGWTGRLNRVSNDRPNAPAGQYQFNEGWTREVFNGNFGGQSIASMLLGLMSGGNISTQPRLAIQVKYLATYLQDDWRVNDRLTLNLGLRWDADLPLTERFDRTSWFDFSAPLPINVTAVPAGIDLNEFKSRLRGGLVYANRNGTPRGNKDRDLNNFAPRIGLAYKLTNRFVARSSFGIFYNPTTGIGPGNASVGALGFNEQTSIVTSNDGGRTPATTIANPFPNGFVRATNGNDGLLSLIGQGINAQVRSDRVPYSMQWNLNLQYELPAQMLLDVAYAGNSGVKLLAQAQLNQIPDDKLALGAQLNAVVNNPFFGIFPATSPLGALTTTFGQLLRPYPHLTGLTHTWGSMAHSSYHALQAKFRRRFSGGLQFLAAYTWSKLLDDFSSVAGFLGQQNPGYTNNNQQRLDKSLSSLDQPHTLVTNFQYDLPFGKGRRFAPDNRALGWLIGGWNLSGVMSLQSGLPISIDSNANTTNSFGGGQRPNKIGPSATTGSIYDRRTNYINAASFVNPPQFTFGTTGRNLPDLRAPVYYNWDLSVLRNFKFTERKALQFRWEMFNAFNRVNFQPPGGTTFGVNTFGVINSAERARIMQFGLKLYY